MDIIRKWEQRKLELLDEYEKTIWDRDLREKYGELVALVNEFLTDLKV